MMAAKEIQQHIQNTCGAVPQSWTWKPITKAEYEASNIWVEPDGFSGTFEIVQPEDGMFRGIKAKNVLIFR
jgi:hypothetical protein